MIQWIRQPWMLSTMPMSSSGDVDAGLLRSAELAAVEAGHPKVVSPWRLAQSTAASTLGLLPEPLMAMARSPGWP